MLTIKSWNKERSAWNCLCDCGKTCVRASSEFKRNRTKSCGCDYRNKPRRLPNYLGLKRRILGSYKQNAKNRKIPFLLTEAEFLLLIDKPCFYCGQLPNTTYKFATFENDFVYNGIDRKDNAKGYTKENCVTCCNLCNLSKRNLPYQVWKEWIFRLANKLSKTEI